MNTTVMPPARTTRATLTLPTSPAPRPADADRAAPGQEGSPVGTLIRSHRLRIGLTQRELADLSTISVRAIRDLEQGKARRPRTDTVRLMADALRLGPRARAALEAAAQQGRAAGGPGWTEPPAPPTALHAMAGRDGETDVLAGELAAGSERLVNVVGLAGVGKTRLALAVAERLHGIGLPVLWHAFPGAAADYLASQDRELAARLEAVAAELFGTRAADGPVDGPVGAAAAGLAELLGEGPALLVLDGVPAAAPHAARLTGLLRACPGLRLLVTSDGPWAVPGERIFLLNPLGVPAAGVADAGSPAVRVFLDHVRRVRPEFTADPADLELAALVCRRLDGHPGALAAAASWLVVYDLAALCRSLAADPAAHLDHLGTTGGGASLRAALHDRLLRLPAGPLALLDALCTRPGGHAAHEHPHPHPHDDTDTLGYELTDITALTCLSLPECGRLLRELLVSGAVRAVHRDGASRFLVPGLVRAARACGAGTTAAAR